MSEMPDATFVRLQMLQPLEPPVSQRGAVKWVRENLFSGWFSTVLTLLSLLVLYGLVALALPWLLHGVWNASSQVECRAIVAQNYGPDADGACWAMIHNRWYQFIFGFFPPSAWWRPVVDFALLFVALAPILYSDDRRTAGILVGTVSVLTVLIMLALGFSFVLVFGTAVVMAALTFVAYTMTHRLLWLVAIYPFLSVWLLWGGSIWGPALAMAGFGVL
ncbi:MAG: amino acid ABC transporter permease, partial [Pseudorhodobacter sp.]|nr:amino acid ABC transporter permease [Pseudorhodobacter sp.]